jgi:hypothetical protein
VEAAMGKHYVPQFYLKGFSVAGEPSSIWLYDKHTGRVALAAIDKVAQQVAFYPDEVEEWLTEEIEKPANAVLDKMRRRVTIAPDDKRHLCDYMAVMLTRVPKGRERIKAHFPQAMENVFRRTEAQLARRMSERPDLAPQLERMLLALKVWRAEYERLVRQRAERHFARPPLWPQPCSALNTMTWRILVCDGGSTLITSDNPVFYFERWGFASRNSEVSFPISKDVALWAGWTKGRDMSYCQARKQDFMEFNCRTASAAMRFLFGPVKENWVLRVAKKARPSLGRLTWE